MFRSKPAIVAAAALFAFLPQSTVARAPETPSLAMPAPSGRSPDPNDPWQGGSGAVRMKIVYVQVTGALPAANVVEVRMALLDPATHCPVPRSHFKSVLSKQNNTLITTSMLAVVLEAQTAGRSVLVFPTKPASAIDGPARDGIPGIVLGAVRTGSVLPECSRP
jgi:hypothetical protein